MANELIFKDAEEARDAIMASQKEEIAKLYEDWADEIGERAKYYSHKSNASAPLSERYYKELQKQIKQTSHEVSNEVYSKIKKNMYTIADAVVADNIKWLESFGFSAEGLNAAFSYVPDEVVRNLITGQIYDSGWSLSARIWGDNEQTLKDIYQVMARGIAENKPIYEIAKNLESYVRPSAKLPWNPILAMKNTKTGEIEYKRIYKKQVDYNAQRLARTLAQHSYQQSFIATTQKNPFITEYIWHSNGSRPCELCQSRDGVHFAKDELPMDHPNGMCTMEPTVAEDMIDQLADWFNSPDGTYPEIDEFAGNFGYEVNLSSFSKDRFFKENNIQELWQVSSRLNPEDPNAYKEFLSLFDESIENRSQYFKDYVSGKIDNKDFDNFFSKYANKKAVSTSNVIQNTTTKAKNIKTSVAKNAKALTDKEIRSSSKFIKQYKLDGSSIEAYTSRLQSTSEEFKNSFMDTIKNKIKTWSNDNTKSTSCQFFSNGSVKINIGDINFSKSTGNTPLDSLFHEVGHAIDHISFGKKYSTSAEFGFKEAMLKDMKAISEKVKSDSYYTMKLKVMVKNDASAGIQDALSAMKYIDTDMGNVEKKVYFNWCHSAEYYTRNDAADEAASELFANMCGAQGHAEVETYMKRYFPETYEKFGEIIKTIASK